MRAERLRHVPRSGLSARAREEEACCENEAEPLGVCGVGKETRGDVDKVKLKDWIRREWLMLALMAACVVGVVVVIHWR